MLRGSILNMNGQRSRAHSDAARTTASLEGDAEKIPTRRSVSFAPSEDNILHNIPQSQARERVLFGDSKVMQEIRHSAMPLNPEAVRLIMRSISTEEESEVVDSCHMDGFALLRMRVGDDSSEIQCAPSRTIWDRTVDMMLQGHRENNYDYACALLNALSTLALDVRAWKTGVSDEGELSPESEKYLSKLKKAFERHRHTAASSLDAP